MQCSTLGNMSLTYRIPNVAFLGLLVSLSLFSGFGTAETIVDTDPHVLLEVGTRGILPCRIQRRAYSVEWKRQLSSETELLVSLDTYLFVGKRDGPGYKAGLFNITEDYSLVIKDVKVQDEGLYICSFSDYQTGKPFQNSTRVSVQAFPDEPFPTIQECIGNFVKPGVCTLPIHAQSNLTCFVKGYYPDIDLFFLHGSEKVTPSAYEEWNNTDGTKNKIITVQISMSDEPYECMASRLPGNAGNRSVLVIGQARSKDPNAAAIVTPVLMVFVVCFSIAGFLKCYLGSGRVLWCNRRGYVLIPSMMHLKAPKGPISKTELWKLVQKVKEKGAFKQLRSVLRRLRRFSKTVASKLEKDDDFYKILCIWKSGTSSKSNQRKTLYHACCKVGLSDITRKLEDFVMDSSHEVSTVNIEHILWEIDTEKIITLMKAFGLDHDAVAIASEKGRREVIETARKELVKWREGHFDINPEVTLSLMLDDLQCETSFFKIQSSQKEEIDVEEIKDICCQIFQQHFTSLLKASRNNHGELAYQIRRFVAENNASLFDTLEMLKDWEQGEECNHYEKRSKLQKAVKAASQRDHTDVKWPPDEDLRVIASFLPPTSMRQLCSKLHIKSPPEEAKNDHEKRFQALTEWRDNHASSKDLMGKYNEFFTALKVVEREGLVPRVKGPLVYKAELVDMAFHLFAQDLLPFTEALGISAAKLVHYRHTFQSSHMTQGTIGLVLKLFESGERSHLLTLLKEMQYPNVFASGTLALGISFEEVCAISVDPANCQQQERIKRKKYSSIKSKPKSLLHHNSFTGIIERTCSLDQVRLVSPRVNATHGDAANIKGVQQRSQNKISNETTDDLSTMLMSASKVKDPDEKSLDSLEALEYFRLLRKEPRMTPINFRLAIANHLRLRVKPELISDFLRGKCNKGKIPFPFIDNILQTMDSEQRCILGNLIRVAPFTSVAARLSIFPFQEEEWSRPADAVSRYMHAWTEEWILQITQTKWKKGEDGILTIAEVAKKHMEFNDRLVDHGFFELAREIMISEQQLMDAQH